MHLALDIGNTRTKWALFNQREIAQSGAISSSSEKELQQLFSEKDFTSLAVASVVSYTSKQLALFTEKNALIAKTDTAVPIEIDYDTPETLGIDRLCAAIGAKATFPNENVLVIDIGTCVKYEFVSSAGVYKGGNISPGLEMRFKALNHYTSKLPLLEPKKVEKLFGSSTNEAIRLGVQQGLLLEIEAIIEKTNTLHPNTKTIITGGDSSFFANEFKTHIFADLLLVLRGLNEIYLHNA